MIEECVVLSIGGPRRSVHSRSDCGLNSFETEQTPVVLCGMTYCREPSPNVAHKVDPRLGCRFMLRQEFALKKLKLGCMQLAVTSPAGQPLINASHWFYTWWSHICVREVTIPPSANESRASR